jgi:hypothetical protein
VQNLEIKAKMNAINNKNDILIYDKSDHLIKLVKHYCGSNIDILFCNESEKLLELNLSQINTVYFSSNDTCDYSDIMAMHQMVNKVYVNTLSLELKLKLTTVEGIFFFDLEKDKFKIMNQIFNNTIGFD